MLRHHDIEVRSEIVPLCNTGINPRALQVMRIVPPQMTEAVHLKEINVRIVANERMLSKEDVIRVVLLERP